ncbi:MAG TPA: hypothetical protein VFN62_09820 [Acidobacteriaceae bacterium]|nr:hypothetical protein [Acidobacteriaceae bacterium]
MLHDDQFMERTSDLVAKIRKLREAAEKEMNRFTRVADYDVRHVVGQKPKASPVSEETTSPSPFGERTKKPAAKPVTAQTAMEFPADIARHADDGKVHP